jgi:type-F conjugative transfer system pilin assembly protein TrbC
MVLAQAQSNAAKARIEQAGDGAVARLKAAIGARKDLYAPAALAPPVSPPPDLQRRAFEAMRRRVPTATLEPRARAAMARGQAQMALERDAMARRLGQALGLDAPDMSAVARATSSAGPPKWVPLIFVSSSMPVAVLRAYAAQSEKARGVLAFRGMPGGLTRVAPMAKLAAQILRLDPGCEGPACAMRNVQLIVDPIVFRQHNVTRVPALTMVPGDPTQPYCERDETSPRGSHVVYGDSALSGLLEGYARLGAKEEVRDAQSRLENR